MVWLLAACSDAPPAYTFCADAEARLGHAVCVEVLEDQATWEAVSLAAEAIDKDRVTTYLVPATDRARIPTVIVNANAFEDPEQSLHYKFLTESFPEFAGLSYDAYLDLTLSDGREWYAGSQTTFLGPGGPFFGFTISELDPVGCDDVQAVLREMRSRVHIGPVHFVPATGAQRELAPTCDVPTHDPSTSLAFETYNAAIGCGTVQRYRVEDLLAADVDGELDWRTLVVVDEAPLDLTSVVGGIVTGTRQGELSHLNVRSANRGTPNCYVRDAYDVVAEHVGELMELECGPGGATLRALSLEEAVACWEAARPDPVEVVPADLSWTEISPLLALPTGAPEERLTGVSRYGSKGTNLAVLYQRIDPSLQLDGFLVPFHGYAAFLEANGFDTDIEAMLGDPTFLSDPGVRRATLEDLIDAMRAAPCDAALTDAVGAAILDVHGADDVMVRFRSSSNAEDALAFNGAGLYDSTSVCLADSTDADDVGPSHCDPEQPDERTICRGLTKVWASLWNPGAYEERDWYGIDHHAAVMGVLVNTRTPDERANVVAFSGNPLLRGDPRYLVNAQVGELDVVAAEPGVFPEADLLTVDGGVVTAIERVKGSSELPEGSWVLSDAILEELGAELATIAEVFPLDADVPDTERILLDTEWKQRSDGHLVIKQIRPFLE